MTREKTEAQSFPFDATRKARRPSAINVDDSVSRFHVQNEGDSDACSAAPFRSAPRTTRFRGYSRGLITRLVKPSGVFITCVTHTTRCTSCPSAFRSVAANTPTLSSEPFRHRRNRCRRRGTRTRSPPRRTSGARTRPPRAPRGSRSCPPCTARPSARSGWATRTRSRSASVAGESVEVSEKRFSALFDRGAMAGGGKARRRRNRGRTSRFTSAARGAGFGETATRHTSTGVVMSSRATATARKRLEGSLFVQVQVCSIGRHRQTAWAKKFVLSRTSRVSSRFVGGSFPDRGALRFAHRARLVQRPLRREGARVLSPGRHARATSAPVAVGALAVNC